MLDRADCADFGGHNSIRLETKHFLNTLALTFISFSGRFVFAMQKHYLFFASDPLVEFEIQPNFIFYQVGRKSNLTEFEIPPEETSVGLSSKLILIETQISRI